jgi:hypothetical protein
MVSCPCLFSFPLFYLNKTTVASKGSAGGHRISGKDIDATTFVNALLIRAKPSSSVQTGHPGHDSVRDLNSAYQLASVVEHTDHVAAFEVSGSSIDRVKPDIIIRQPFQTRDVVEKGVDPGPGVGTHKLKRVFLDKGIAGALPGLDILRKGRDQGVIHFHQSLAVDLDLS